jgi:hypothetical protein
LCPCGKNFCLMTRGLRIEQLSSTKINTKQLQQLIANTQLLVMC